jgi:hypothetical protein
MNGATIKIRNNCENINFFTLTPPSPYPHSYPSPVLRERGSGIIP